MRGVIIASVTKGTLAAGAGTVHWRAFWGCEGGGVVAQATPAESETRENVHAHARDKPRQVNERTDEYKEGNEELHLCRNGSSTTRGPRAGWPTAQTSHFSSATPCTGEETSGTTRHGPVVYKKQNFIGSGCSPLVFRFVSEKAETAITCTGNTCC